MMRARVLLALLGASLLCACKDATEPGRAAWTAGDVRGAHERFHAALESQGDDASAALCYDAAYSAWRLGDARAASELAIRAEERARATQDVGAGSAAAALRAQLAWELAASLADAPPDDIVARERRVALVEEALAAWARSAVDEGDGAAARNVERALHLLDRLRERKAGNARPRPKPLPRPAPGAAPEATPRAEETQLPGATANALSDAEVARLAEVLAAKEQEKAALRAQERARQGAGVEKDW
ncbi:MAG: hypothetical protein H6806_07130 [Planctomycetes bacterium]|nr:hypothetical protein [Planctomycetota bacterium]MCB9825454.1 hypothetical protein [Planctomycetota bacterium]MCB9829517.1 hypothetical protein [Planctomycetota bacterium]MCB9900548.1 hypothetical protein [Planctomycetota bacterium]